MKERQLEESLERTSNFSKAERDLTMIEHSKSVSMGMSLSPAMDELLLSIINNAPREFYYQSICVALKFLSFLGLKAFEHFAIRALLRVIASVM